MKNPLTIRSFSWFVALTFLGLLAVGIFHPVFSDLIPWYIFLALIRLHLFVAIPAVLLAGLIGIFRRDLFKPFFGYFYFGIWIIAILFFLLSAVWRPAWFLKSLDLQAIEQKHDEITQSSVFSDFVGKVTSENYAEALLLLHPELAEAWTVENFTQDWSEIRSQLGDQWAPESTGSFSGVTAQGQYEEAGYRLSSDWRSPTSLELTSIIVDDASKIVQIHIRAPYEEGPPGEVVTVAENFINALSTGDVAAAHELIAAAYRPLMPEAMLEQLKSIGKGSPFDGERKYYRLSANTVWYDAMRFTPSNEPATFLELRIDSSGENAQIISLAYKMRP